MSLRNILVATTVAALCAIATGGNFVIVDEDPSSVSVHYTGTVYDSDVFAWRQVSDYAGHRVVLLTIDSGGGSAYGGLELYWALEAHPRLVTIAGGQTGAWSAAAIMWLAGDHKLIAEHGAVWFHAAFCTWDPEPVPDIGCNTSGFQTLLVGVLSNAGYHGETFNWYLNHVQFHYGTDGWIGVDADGWWLRDTGLWYWETFREEALK